MDGMEIINSFRKETSYEFSEAIALPDSKIYLIFKVDIISINPNPSKSLINKLKGFKRTDENKTENSLSHLILNL